MEAPDRFRPYNLGIYLVRNWVCSRLVIRSGRNLYVKKGADFSPNIVIGDDSELGQRCQIYGGVEIGSRVLMGPDIKIITRNHRYGDMRSVAIGEQGEIFNPVKIGNNVWIGSNVIKLPGVNVGDCVVIGAGAVVTKDIPGLSVVAGNPAKVVKWISEADAGGANNDQ
jgi:maltose O-acetyltransferase